MDYCKSCNFPINEGETKKKCEECQGTTHLFCLINKDGVKVCDQCYMVSQEKPKRIDFIMPDSIRRTYIETYRKCPNKFKLEVLDGNSQPPNKYTQVGIDLHEVFDKAVNDRSYTHDDMFDEYFDKYVPKQEEMGIFETEEDHQKFMLRAETSIKNFYGLLPSIPTPFATEETVHYSIGDDVPLVQFTMDLITENQNGNLELHDWKTGKVMVGQTISSDLQAPLYIYGVQQHYNRIVDAFTFHYVNEGKTRTFNRINSLVYECKVGKRSYYINLEDAMKEIKSVFNQIKKGNFNIPQDTSKMFFACKMCHLKEQGLCSGADQESWYQMNGGRKNA